MQLKNIGKGLASATCALLGTAQAEQEPWEVSSAVMVYSEKDRVTAFEPSFYATKTLEDDSKVGVFFVFDSLTGASPNGAAPSLEMQTFTSPSGGSRSQTRSGELPVDDTFKDTRVQIGASIEKPLSRFNRYSIGANVSAEHDYSSAAMSLGYTQDFYNKNTSVTVSGAFAFDQINPEGDVPSPLTASSIDNSDTKQTDGSSKDKQVLDLMLGITQVINRSTLMLFNLGISQSDGYHNDPYKIVSRVNSQGRSQSYLFENRPDKRLKQYAYWQTNYHTPWFDTLTVSYRLLADDWGLDSHTFDIRYRFNVSDKLYLQPRVRLYNQSAVDFYRHSIRVNETTPEFVSADQRLAEFDATTLGLELGYRLANNNTLRFRLETYQQKGNSSPSNAVGEQQQLDMFQGVDAVIGQLSYDFKW